MIRALAILLCGTALAAGPQELNLRSRGQVYMDSAKVIDGGKFKGPISGRADSSSRTDSVLNQGAYRHGNSFLRSDATDTLLGDISIGPEHKLILDADGHLVANGDQIDMGTSASYVGGLRVLAGRSFNTKLEQNTGLDLAGRFVVYSQAAAQQLFAITSGFSTSDGYVLSTYPLNIGFYEESYAGNAMLDGLTGTHAPFAVYGVGLTAPRLTVQDTNDTNPLWLYDNAGTLAASFGKRCSTSTIIADTSFARAAAVVSGSDTLTISHAADTTFYSTTALAHKFGTTIIATRCSVPGKCAIAKDTVYYGVLTSRSPARLHVGGSHGDSALILSRDSSGTEVVEAWMSRHGNWHRRAGDSAVYGQAGGSASWGGIGGTLSAQTDLQGALDGKSATTHNHDGAYAPNAHVSTADAHLPSQTGNNGKFLTTNGTATSWGTPAGGGSAVVDSTFAMNEWWIQKNLGALTTIANVGFATAPTVRGTATAFQDTFGSFLNYASAAVIDSPAGWRSNIYTELQLRQAPQLTFRIKTGAAATDTNKCVYWVGLLGGDYKRLGDSATWNIAAFRYATALDSTLKTWQFVTKAGGAAGVNTVTNTGVPIECSKAYVFTVKAFPNTANTAIDSVQGCINGARVACHTTTIPAFAQNLGYYCMITTKTTVAHAIRISKIYGRQR